MNKNPLHIIDLKIIDGCKQGKASAQKELYNISISRLYNVAYRILSNKQETEDAIQESYMKIFNKIAQYQPQKGTIYNWMDKICINTSINYLKRKRFQYEDIEELYIVPSNKSSTLENLEAEYILQLMQCLSKQSRIIFNLYEIEGYSHKEIAVLLEINVNSCRVHLSRAKTKLQSLITKMHINSNKTTKKV